MMIATLNDAMDLLVLSGTGTLAVIVLAGWLFSRALRSPDVPVKVVGGLMSFLLGGGAFVVGGFFFVIGLAVAGCPPDANECPF